MSEDIRISPNAISEPRVIGIGIKKYNQAITKIERLEKELEDTRIRVRVTAEYWRSLVDKRHPETNNRNLIISDVKKMDREKLEKFAEEMRIERNSFIIGKDIAEDKIIELETELYFCNRNKRIKDIVDEKTKLET
tara:strand:- start:95 stop:502 length:408 start_codon:yes stop_codon:yes gene_type:complete